MSMTDLLALSGTGQARLIREGEISATELVEAHLQRIEAEAQAQAICMATNDFHRAYHAFVEKQKPVFKGD